MACSNCSSGKGIEPWKWTAEDGDYASFGDRGGGWAIIRPTATPITNLCKNGSFEANRDGWHALLADTVHLTPTVIGVSNEASYAGAYSLRLSNSQGGSVACQYDWGDSSLILPANGSLCASVMIKSCANASITLTLGATVGVGAATQSGGRETYTATTSDWAEYAVCAKSLISTAQAVDFEITVTPGGGCPTPFLAYIDAVVITQTDTAVAFFDGDNGGNWNGTPYESTSTISANTRLFGEPVFLGDLGLTLLGDDGAGLPPLERSVDAYAHRPGSALTGTHWGSRTIRFTLGIQENSWKAVAAVRKKLVDLLALDPMSQCGGNELLLRRYCIDGCDNLDLTKYYELVVNYNAGLQAVRSGVFAEKIVLELVADENPLYQSPAQLCTPLTANVAAVINNPTSISLPIQLFVRNGAATVIDQVTNSTTDRCPDKPHRMHWRTYMCLGDRYHFLQLCRTLSIGIDIARMGETLGIRSKFDADDLTEQLRMYMRL